MRNFSRVHGLRANVRKLTLALGAIAALVGLTFFGLAKAQSAPVTFSVYPVPGTLTASAKTQISFRGGDADAVGDVKVTGSRSGAHDGKLKAHSDGLGASFVPDKPFKEGEKVTVDTGLTVVNATDGDYSFTVGDETRRTLRPVEAPDVGRGSVQSFTTRPDLDPPAVAVTTNKPGTAPGLIFLAPKGGRGQDGPMIIDNAGELVWFKSTPGKVSADFRVQTYKGKPVLTWWEGQLFVGDGDGVGKIYDTSYKPVAEVRTGNGYTFDLHEFTITPRNTALVLAYERYNRSLKPWGGPSKAQDRRQHRPGGRPRDRARAVRVAQLRQRLAGRVLHPGAQAERLGVGVLPRQRGRHRQRRQHPRLRPQHPRGLQDQPRDGQDHVAHGRQEVDAQARQGRQVRLAAQHPRAARRHLQAL